MSNNKNVSRCETDAASSEPWIDVLSKALAGEISRRTTLKILMGSALAGLAATVGGSLSSCGNSNTPTDLCPTCGTCSECSINTKKNTATCVACADTCAAANLCKQAANNTEYKLLATSLTQRGFVSKWCIRQVGGKIKEVKSTSEGG